MDKMENYDQQYAEYYQTEYETLLRRLATYIENFNHHSLEKIRRDFKKRIITEKANLIGKDEPIDAEGTSFNVLRNAYKEEVLKAFKNREEKYRINPVTIFIEEELPVIRAKHVEHLHSGKFPLDYQWDMDFIENHTINDFLQLMANYFAKDRFIGEVDLLAIELEKQIEDEKKLVKENKFNDLAPKEVYDFFLQLINRIPEGCKPMLTKDQVITLTNMICRNVDVVKKIKADVKNRKGQLRYFVYKFYLHSKNPSTGAEESNLKYISILTRYIDQFNNIKVNNFATEPRKFDVNLHDKYLH
jgi:hypothetical protein